MLTHSSCGDHSSVAASRWLAGQVVGVPVEEVLASEGAYLLFYQSLESLLLNTAAAAVGDEGEGEGMVAWG